MMIDIRIYFPFLLYFLMVFFPYFAFLRVDLFDYYNTKYEINLAGRLARLKKMGLIFHLLYARNAKYYFVDENTMLERLDNNIDSIFVVFPMIIFVILGNIFLVYNFFWIETRYDLLIGLLSTALSLFTTSRIYFLGEWIKNFDQ